jgi:hypothetical protein
VCGVCCVVFVWVGGWGGGQGACGLSITDVEWVEKNRVMLTSLFFHCNFFDSFAIIGNGN